MTGGERLPGEKIRSDFLIKKSREVLVENSPGDVTVKVSVKQSPMRGPSVEVQTWDMNIRRIFLPQKSKIVPWWWRELYRRTATGPTCKRLGQVELHKVEPRKRKLVCKFTRVLAALWPTSTAYLDLSTTSAWIWDSPQSAEVDLLFLGVIWVSAVCMHVKPKVADQKCPHWK